MSETDALLARLRRHYIKPGEAFPGGVFIPECGWNAGSGGRRVDALYVGFTGSSGRLLMGHELKVSRADWRKELDSPGKADPWADECHAWWIVAPTTAIVPAAEVPAGWGLMVPDPRSKVRMRVELPATVHPEREPSWLACRSIMARLDTLQAQGMAEARIAERDRASAEVDERVAARLSTMDVARAQAHAKQAEDRLAEITEALGTHHVRTNDHPTSNAEIHLDTLRALAPLLRDVEALARARAQLADRYRHPTARARQVLDELERALDGLREVPLTVDPP